MATAESDSSPVGDRCEPSEMTLPAYPARRPEGPKVCFIEEKGDGGRGGPKSKQLYAPVAVNQGQRQGTLSLVRLATFGRMENAVPTRK